ncbi:phosphoadenosine phosphosulfate reductase family protein [Actinokineospora baliensis]|uniref:phosphoadenosine phosphosulfate reductase family protein n=1 Tax=Actinokineospora baliensis TaxID=547056 RepID=UPI001EF7F424|nr:phosphoadenosine phosphosulfate reductase family protein [Actinokineospora baliensis]
MLFWAVPIGRDKPRLSRLAPFRTSVNPLVGDPEARSGWIEPRARPRCALRPGRAGIERQLDLKDHVWTSADVAALSATQREERLSTLIDQAHRIVDEAIAEHAAGKSVVATCVLFSGGNDSTALTHLMRERATHAIHANTTIGIEATRVFVRETCRAWGLPLLERFPPEGSTYRDLVLAQGFPGPAHHFKMYQRLKERGLRQARRELVTHPRRERVIFIAGRRREESARRIQVPLHEREGSVVWVSPLALWTKLDLNTYRARFAVPRNPVADHLHMSGECLCGAFAASGELDEIRQWYPDVVRWLDRLSAEALARGITPERCEWGWGAYRSRGSRGAPRSGPLCQSCSTRSPS